MSADALPPPPLDRYLGSGHVVGVTDERVTVALEEGTVVRATPALTFPYQPVAGDELLVIGDEEAFWVIGVLRGRGATQLSATTSLRAEGGRLDLAGDRGVSIRGPRVTLRADQLGRAALETVQTFGKLERRIRETIVVEAGDLDEHSCGRWLVQAGRVIVKTLRKTRIESRTVRLG